jgi:RNA recognition motif-containing protein
VKLFCGNLSYSVKSEDLRELFEEYGEVTSANVITDRASGQSKGFGFVEMPDNAQATAAMEGLNGAEVEGRALTVNEARPQTNDRRPGGGYGGGREGGRGGREGGRGGFNGGGGGFSRGGGSRY